MVTFVQKFMFDAEFLQCCPWAETKAINGDLMSVKSRWSDGKKLVNMVISMYWQWTKHLENVHKQRVAIVKNQIIK